MSKDYTDIIGEVISNNPQPVDKPNNRYDEFLPELFNDVSPNEESIIRDRDFEEDYIPDQFAFDDSQVQDVNQLQAELQPWMDKAGAFVGKTVGKTLIEFTKGLGYLAGAPAALVTGDLENMTNNFFIEALDEAGEELNEALPVYVKNSIRDGNLLDKLGSMDFWANEGADGLGFLLSSIGIGGVVNKLGKLANLSNKVNLGLTSAAQTLVESAAETSGLATQLNDYWEGRIQNDGTYLDENNNVLTAQQVQERKGQALASTFWSNAMLLAVPNMVMTNTIFGKGSTMKNMLGPEISGIKGASSLDNMMANLEKITPWKAGARNAAKNVLKVGSSEGFQEWSQFAIEHYNSELAKNLTNDNVISGLFEGYTKGLTEVDGQAAIALGFIFGAGASVIGSYKDGKANAKKQRGLASLINNASNSYKETLKSIYTIDENGNYKVDPEKIADLVDSNIKDLTLEDYYKKARANGETAAAKYALGKLAIQHAAPFMNQDEGMNIWDQIVEENDETYQADYKELGFASKNEMKQYIKDVANSAKKENDKFIEEGYKLFNINKKLLYRNKENKAAIDEAYNEFINKMSNVNIELNFQRNAVKQAIGKVKQAISEEQENIIPVEGEEETIESPITKFLNAKLKQLNKQLKKINEDYAILYDPAEHESAFNKYYFSKLALKDAVAADAQKKQERSDTVQQFYQDLEDKGYNVLDNPEINDFSRDIIALVDKEGTVYRVGKRKLKNGSTEFVIKNVETNEATPFTADLLETKFVGSDAILSTEEFKEFKKAKKVLQLNQKKLDTLNNLISDNDEQTVKAIETLKELNKEAEFYNDYLENIDLEATNRPANEIFKDIEEASSLLDSINIKINSLKETLNTLEESKVILLDLKSQLEQVIEDNKDADILQNFSFNKIYQDLKAELDKNQVDTKIDDINLSIEYGELVIDEWSQIQADFQDIVDDLYESLGDYKWLRDFIPTLTAQELEEIKRLIQFKNPLISEEDAENYLGLEDASDLEKFTKIKDLLDGTDTRLDVIKLLNDKIEASTIYLDLAKQDLASMKKKVKKAKAKLDKLYKFKELVKVENLFATSLLNIKREYNLQAAKEMDISPEQIKNTPEQSDVMGDKFYLHRKATPFSSIVSVWEYSGYGKVNYDNGRNGKSKNWKQAALWADTVKDIDNTKVDEYSVRFMSPTQLKNLGINPPSIKADDVYIILYHNGELVKKNNQIPFAGLAFPATYFNQDDVMAISLRDNPVFKMAVAKKEALGEDFTFEHNGNNYTTLSDLEMDLYAQMEKDYTEWRNNIVNQLSQGKSLYSQATNFSPGMPVITDVNTKNPVSKVFKGDNEIVIPSSDRYGIGDKVVPVEPGMVYIKTENGQLHRVLNRRIDSLSPKKKAETINRILKFMALGYFVKGNLAQNIKVVGSKGSYPLLGSKNGTGILDYYINWGDKKSFSHSISIGTQKKTGEMFIKLIDPKNGEKIYFDLKDLFNGKPSENTVKPYGDPTIKLITDFLESKYLNVNKKMATSQPQNFEFWLPKDWKMVKGNPQIIVDKKVPKKYKDYVLKEILYTNVNESNSNDEIPNFVNQYVTFDKTLNEGPKKPAVKVEPQPIPQSEIIDKAPTAQNFQNNDNPSALISFTDGEGNLKKFEAMTAMIKPNVKEKEAEETCKVPKAKGNMFEQMKKTASIKGDKLDL